MLVLKLKLKLKIRLMLGVVVFLREAVKLRWVLGVAVEVKSFRLNLMRSKADRSGCSCFAHHPFEDTLDTQGVQDLILRGTILSRTYGEYKNLRISLFLLQQQYLVLFTMVPRNSYHPQPLAIQAKSRIGRKLYWLEWNFRLELKLKVPFRLKLKLKWDLLLKLDSATDGCRRSRRDTSAPSRPR